MPFLLAAVLPASALLAQTAPTPAPAPTIQPEEVEEDVVGSLDNDAKIAIPAFATNADVPTQTSAGSTSTLGFSVANVIFADLRNNGLFQPTGPSSLPPGPGPGAGAGLWRLAFARGGHAGAGLCPRRSWRQHHRGLLSL